MSNIKQILKYSDRRFKRIFGVSKRVFKIMETIISKEFKIKKLMEEEKGNIALQYY